MYESPCLPECVCVCASCHSLPHMNGAVCVVFGRPERFLRPEMLSNLRCHTCSRAHIRKSLTHSLGCSSRQHAAAQGPRAHTHRHTHPHDYPCHAVIEHLDGEAVRRGGVDEKHTQMSSVCEPTQRRT